MRLPRVPAEEQYRLIMECRKSGLSDQEVVKIEMNSLSASNAIDKSTDASVMELVIGNTGLRIPNGTDPMLLAKTIRIRAELSCQAISQLPMSLIS